MSDQNNHVQFVTKLQFSPGVELIEKAGNINENANLKDRWYDVVGIITEKRAVKDTGTERNSFSFLIISENGRLWDVWASKGSVRVKP